MIYSYPFKNYSEFKTYFPKRQVDDGNGGTKTIMTNELVFKYHKDFIWKRYLMELNENTTSGWVKNLCYLFMHANTFPEIDRYFWSFLSDSCFTKNGVCTNYCVNSLNGKSFYLDYNKICVDNDGICSDGTAFIRYINRENDKVFKMKPGRFFERIIEGYSFIEFFPKVMLRRIQEQFCTDWQAYVSSSQYTLKISDDFEEIYNDGNYADDMGSCMQTGTRQDRWKFYKHTVKSGCRAASLWKFGKIYARCVIFDNVRCYDDDEVYRLAERQYSAGKDESIKQILVDMLIEQGEIDGYKRVGASYDAHHSFVSVDGKDWSGKDFFINLDDDNLFEYYVSYQDSFVYYDKFSERAYNDKSYKHQYELDVLDGSPDGSCLICPECDEEFDEDDGYYSEITGETYCCESCQERAEDRYREDYWYYSELLDEYYEDNDDLRDAEREFKKENWYYSEITDEYYETEDELDEAEEDYKEENWYESECVSGKYFKDSEDRDDFDDEYREENWFYCEFDEGYVETKPEVFEDKIMAYNYKTCKYELQTISVLELNYQKNNGYAVFYNNLWYIGNIENGMPVGVPCELEKTA